MTLNEYTYGTAPHYDALFNLKAPRGGVSHASLISSALLLLLS